MPNCAHMATRTCAGESLDVEHAARSACTAPSWAERSPEAAVGTAAGPWPRAGLAGAHGREHELDLLIEGWQRHVVALRDDGGMAEPDHGGPNAGPGDLRVRVELAGRHPVRHHPSDDLIDSVDMGADHAPALVHGRLDHVVHFHLARSELAHAGVHGAQEVA